MKSLYQFYFDSILYARMTEQRYGQALFNQLAEHRPDLAEQVRGTSIDPFYLCGPWNNPEKWDAFISFVETNWR